MVLTDIKDLHEKKYQFLSGGGEMGMLTRAKDWSKTAVGSPEEWPQSLRTIIGIVLNSKFPMFLWWGAELICFYNDAYRPSLGQNGKHPDILGIPAKQAWPEIWHIIKPLIDQVLGGGEATWSEDQLIPINRNGKLEDVYWTFSYSPVNDESGRVGGVLVTCTETTDKILTYKKLEESKRQLEFAIDAARLGTWDYDPTTNKFTCNSRLKEWFGLPPDHEIDLQYAINVIVDKDRRRIIDAIQKALDFSSGGTYEEEYSIINPVTQKETIVYAKGKTLFTDEKVAWRFNGTLEDVTEQVNARKKIEESEKKFRTMAESADILIGVSDENAGATYFNKSWGKLTGRPVEELLNFGWADLLHPDDKESFLNRFAKAFENKSSYEGEFRVMDRNGDYRWIYAKIPVRLHPDGSYAGHISSCIDITDLKKTETELKLTQQRLRSFVESAPFPIGVYIGREMRIALVNDAILQAWGRSKDIVGKLYKEVLTELAGQGVYEQLDAVFTTGVAFHAKNQHLDLLVDGKIQPYYYNYSFTPLFDENGEVYGILNTGANVTDLNLATKKIEQSEESLRNLVLQSPIGICILNAETLVIEIVNDSFIEVAGKTYEAIYGKPYWEPFAEAKPFYETALNNVIETGIVFSASEVEMMLVRHGREEIIYVTFVYAPLNDADGKVNKVAVWVLDNTQQVIARQKIEEADKRFRDTVRQAPVGITILRGKDYVVDMANDAYLQLVDRKENEFVGRPLFDSLPEVEETVHQLLDNVIETGTAFYGIEYAIPVNRYGKQEVSYFNFVYHPLKEEDGTISGIIVTVTDVNETVRAKQSLAESEKQFRNMVTHSPVAMAILRGKEHLVEVANKTMLESMWKKTADEVTGKKIFEIFPELKSQKYAALLHDVYTSGKIHTELEAVIELQTADGPNTFYADIQYAPMVEPDNSISGIMITSNDVTTQVKARQAIEESEQRLRSFVESAPFPIGVYVGKEMLIQLVNQSIINVWGKGNDVIGKKYADVLPELAGTGIYEQLNAVYNTGIPFHAHNQRIDLVINNKIESRYFNYSFTPVFDGAGKVYGVMNTAAEVTDLAIAKQKVEASEKEFRELADRLPELVWTTDKDGMQTFASVRWREFTGLDPYDASTFEKMTHPDDLQNLMGIWSNCLATGDIYKAQVRLKSKEGDYQWFYVHGEPIRNEEGNIEKWIGAFTNFNEQKKIEEELVAAVLQIEESEKRFRNVANSAPVLIWMAGTDRMRYFFNTAWLDFTGRNLEQELGNGWAESVHPEDFKKYLHHYLAAFEKCEEFYTEYRLRRHDGEYRWVSAKGVPRFTVDGVFEGFIGACMDIHERVIYQKKLKEDEERLNIIINASELGTWEFNLKTQDVQYSDRYLQIFGYDDWVELTHEQLMTHLHPDDLVLRKLAFERAFETGLLHYESRVIWKDQTVHWFEGKGKVFYDEQNEPHHLIGTIRDITEEKYFQQELLAREKKFRLLADAMPEFVWTSDVLGNMNYFNQSVYNYTGLTPDDMIKDGWLQIIHPEDLEENVDLWMGAIKSGRDFIFEHRFRRYDGKYRWQLSRATPQRDTEGNIQMWVGTSTDIQDIKEQDQQKDLFISMASHELKTPVTSIKGYVQILQSMYAGSKDKFLKTSLNTVDKQIVTLTNLISELLDLSKIKSGSLVLNQQDFAINQLIKETIKEIKQINPGYNISFSGNSKIMVRADRGRIGQVLINFLNNAIKYSPDANQIKVKSTVSNNSVVISVQDGGIGIEKQDQEKIFHRFYRVEGKNENTFPGFGIGLFIASEIIKRHHGNIGVTSEPGKGSTFYFSIPLNHTPDD